MLNGYFVLLIRRLIKQRKDDAEILRMRIDHLDDCRRQNIELCKDTQKMKDAYLLSINPQQ